MSNISQAMKNDLAGAMNRYPAKIDKHIRIGKMKKDSCMSRREFWDACFLAAAANSKLCDLGMDDFADTALKTRDKRWNETNKEKEIWDNSPLDPEGPPFDEETK